MAFHRMPFGAELSNDGVRFSLWAPDAQDVAIVIDGAKPRPVARDDDGFALIHVPQARAGTHYQWVIDGRISIPDPASRFQPDGVFGPSLVVDPQNYSWRLPDWRGRPWEEAIIYEVHVGAATTQGTFRGLRERLDALSDLGVTMIELMPIAEVPGHHNWGYDGVLPFSPNAAYGGPDDLKRLIDDAHERGLMVMLDVVYNHFGPSGNFLPLYAARFFTDRHRTPWGDAIDFDQRHRQMVRDFIIHNALYWLEEYRFDGLRLDAVHAIRDESHVHVLAELAGRVRAAFQDRQIHLVLENEHNSAHWLRREPSGKPSWYTAQWSDDIHHAWHVLLTGERDAYYQDFANTPLTLLGRALAEGFAYQGEVSQFAGRARGEASSHLPPQAFVSFLQNHDQIGNRALGQRLSALTEPSKLAIAHAVLLLSPHIPLLFMGEEWDASTPFLFFVDFAHDDDLASAVREGRRGEFAHFADFAEEARAQEIPDPTSPATFTASVLRWEERIHSPHADRIADMRRLIDLRRKYIVPLLASGSKGAIYRLHEGGGLDVHWRFGVGDLRLFLNIDGSRRHFMLGPMQRVIWQSAHVEINALFVRMPAWSAMVTLEAARGR